MSRDKPAFPELSDEDEARIQAGIAADPDAAELTDEELARIRPASEVLPPGLYEALTKRPRGRPPAAAPKQQVTMRLDADVVAGLRATGAGWQVRVNDLLREWLRDKPSRAP